MAKVYGTANSETLNALDGITSGADLIFGRGGNDNIYGLGGDDEVYGMDDNDTSRAAAVPIISTGAAASTPRATATPEQACSSA